MPASSSPSLKVLANEVAAMIPQKWHQVAIQLELEKAKRDIIRINEKIGQQEQFMAVLEHWENSCCLPYTWGTLLTALESRAVGEQKLADQLKQKFNIV